jgi:hypothetical protein
LYFDKHSLSFVMKLSIEQLGLAMETNPQNETGSWLHHGTRREDSEAEIPGDFPASKGPRVFIQFAKWRRIFR